VTDVGTVTHQYETIFDATVAEHGLIGRQEVLEVQNHAPALPHVADALGLDDGAPMVMRFVRMYADDAPVRLARTWFPAEWASGTAFADTRKVRGGVAGLVEELRGRIAASDVDSSRHRWRFRVTL
jgi:GntR family transcriptional regulator